MLHYSIDNCGRFCRFPLVVCLWGLFPPKAVFLNIIIFCFCQMESPQSNAEPEISNADLARLIGGMDSSLRDLKTRMANYETRAIDPKIATHP